MALSGKAFKDTLVCLLHKPIETVSDCSVWTDVCLPGCYLVRCYVKPTQTWFASFFHASSHPQKTDVNGSGSLKAISNFQNHNAKATKHCVTYCVGVGIKFRLRILNKVDEDWTFQGELWTDKAATFTRTEVTSVHNFYLWGTRERLWAPDSTKINFQC